MEIVVNKMLILLILAGPFLLAIAKYFYRCPELTLIGKISESKYFQELSFLKFMIVRKGVHGKGYMVYGIFNLNRGHFVRNEC